MPINKETIISVFTEKLTLEQWLKTINKALDEAVLTGVEIAKKGNATLSFKFTFEDGTFLETNDIVLQQGESVNGAYIQNGHLYLTLTNGTNLDAGNVKPVSSFSIDANQHLIVNYGDGTNQDLGAIFNGNVNISGTLNATKITGNEIVETMGASYAWEADTPTANYEQEDIYVGCCKNGNKITFVIFTKITNLGNIENNIRLGQFSIPASVGSKLYTTNIGGYAYLDFRAVSAISDTESVQQIRAYIQKYSNYTIAFGIKGQNAFTANTPYYVRLEVTFLLSDNLAQ